MHHRSRAKFSSHCAAIGLTVLFAAILAGAPGRAQTDETIFREFQFDFSTPGARANGMGRAFVGLADEATAAYNNPAGLSVLNAPEFSLEYRFNHNEYAAIVSNDQFTISQGEPQTAFFDLDRVGFASYSFSLKPYNFSAFFVNNLDYRREPVQDRIVFLENEQRYFATYLNIHEVRRIELNTFGLSVSRDFGRLSLGAAVALSRLSLDFDYQTSLSSLLLGINDLFFSETQEKSAKMTYVLGAHYQLNPKLTAGIAYKIQPKFVYSEQIRSSEFPTGAPAPVTFKIPDSIQVGFGYQPNDLWTILLDVDWIKYKQILGDNMTILSSIEISPDFFSFEAEDFEIGDTPEVHLGAEYLIPFRKNILALRAGSFLDPDHKTRFVGQPEEGEDPALFDVQGFIFNTGDKENNIGYTAGIGFVWNNKLQWDVALVRSDRFRRVVASFLYRF